MQVAVALAHPPRLQAGVEHRRQRGKARLGPGLDAREFTQQRRIGHPLADLREVLPHRRHHRHRVAKAVAWLRHRRALVEGGDVAGEAVEQRRLELPGREPRLEQRGLIETAHPDEVVERGRARGCSIDTLIANAHPLLRLPYRHHRLVKLRHRAPVQAQLRLARLASAFHRAEIQEAQIERLLQLPGMLAGEQHPRDVGLDQAHTTRRVGQHAGLAQAGEQFFGCVHGIGLWGHPGNGSP